LVERLNAAIARGTTAPGAERKHATFSTNFCSPRENGHSRYGHLTARFAPKPTVIAAPEIGRIGVGMQTSLFAAMTMPQAA
jgi:hypothetical protein